eukprot:102227-Rhodomonas_salina.1
MATMNKRYLSPGQLHISANRDTMRCPVLTCAWGCHRLGLGKNLVLCVSKGVVGTFPCRRDAMHAADIVHGPTRRDVLILSARC